MSADNTPEEKHERETEKSEKDSILKELRIVQAALQIGLAIVRLLRM